MYMHPLSKTIANPNASDGEPALNSWGVASVIVECAKDVDNVQAFASLKQFVNKSDPTGERFRPLIKRVRAGDEAAIREAVALAEDGFNKFCHETVFGNQ